MARPDKSPRPTLDLVLPTIDQRRVLGARLIQRAAAIMVAVFGFALVLLIIIASTVSIRVTVDGTGLLEPVHVVPVRPSQDGLIRHILVFSGDTVHRDQPLFVLDSLDLATNLASFEAQYRGQLIAREQLLTAQPVDRQRQEAQAAQAEAHIVRARASLRERMVEHRLGSNVDSLVTQYTAGSHVGIDLVVSDLRVAEAERQSAAAESARLSSYMLGVRALEAKLSELQTSSAATKQRMERLVIRAPSEGVILTEQLDRLLGGLVHPGEQVLEIGDPSSWHAIMLVNEEAMHDIRAGDSVSVDVPALRELQVPRLFGVVAAVGSTPTSLSTADPASVNTGKSGMYRVVVSLDQAQLHDIGIAHFRRGYSATAKIVTRKGVILRLILDKATSDLRHRTSDIK